MVEAVKDGIPGAMRSRDKMFDLATVKTLQENRERVPLQKSAIAHGKDAGARVPGEGVLVSVNRPEEIDSRVKQGSVVLLRRSVFTGSGDHFPEYRRVIRKGATAIIEEGGAKVDHGCVAARELGVPVVVDVVNARGLESLANTSIDVRVFKGGVYPNAITKEQLGYKRFDFSQHEAEVKRLLSQRRPNGLKFMINLGFPEILERTPELARISDGVGFLRTEFIWMDVLNGVHPMKMINESRDKDEAYIGLVDALKDKFRVVLNAFGGKSADAKMVWFRTQDLGSDLLGSLDGSEAYEKGVKSPIGARGSVRRLKDMPVFCAEADALRELAEEGYNNIGVFGPMIADAVDFETWDRVYFDDLGLRGNVKEGIMIEIPGAGVTFSSIMSVLDERMRDAIVYRMMPEEIRGLRNQNSLSHKLGETSEYNKEVSRYMREKGTNASKLILEFRDTHGEEYELLKEVYWLHHVIVGPNDYGQGMMLADRTEGSLSRMHHPLTAAPVRESLSPLIWGLHNMKPGIQTAITPPDVPTAEYYRSFGISTVSINPDLRTITEIVKALVPYDRDEVPELWQDMQGRAYKEILFK